MKIESKTNIEDSTYRGLIIVTFIMITIFIFRTMLFSYETHSYDETDKKFSQKELFTKDSVENNTSENVDVKVENIKQKNIIKDLTVKQKIVNINTSLKEELVELPGIGPKTADKIIKYRKEYGDFQTKSELTKVKGIGSVKLKKIENLIKLK